MAENDEPKPDNGLPGVSLDVFEAGVRALAELRDSGRYSIFLGRQTSLKLVGKEEDFRGALAKHLERPVSENEAGTALREIKSFCRVGVNVRQADRIDRYFETKIYAGEFKELGDQAKEKFRQLLKDKVACVSQHLLTAGMHQRRKRMETATGPCLEDLDVEVVRERRDDYRGTGVKEPFLRVRLRYSEGTDLFAFLFSMFGGLVLDDVPPFPVRSFEFECDESDIDLLMFRLTAAKKLLLWPEETEPEQEPT